MGHPVDWDFSEVASNFFGPNAGLIQLHTSLSGWGDDDEDRDAILYDSEVSGPGRQAESAFEGIAR